MQEIAKPASTCPLEAHSSKFAVLAGILQSLRIDGEDRLGNRMVVMSYFTTVRLIYLCIYNVS